MPESDPEIADQTDDEESGGSLGAKVVLFVVGGILLIGAVIGGLAWYTVSSKRAKEAEVQAQIVTEIEKARGAINDTKAGAAKFADEFDTFAARATKECQKPTDELAKILPPEQAARLKPSPSQELLDAIAATNEVSASAVAEPNGKATSAQPKAEEKAAPAAEENASDDPAPQAVIAINELWERAYSCQASAIRIRHAVRKLIAKAEEADALKDETRENMDKLGELSRTLVDMLEQIKNSKDVENVRKGITFIKSKGENTVKQTVKEIRLKKIQDQRKKDEEERKKAEEERKRKAEEAKKAKIEEETAAAKAKFDAIAVQGCFRQLNWTGALRQLEAAKGEMTTAQGQLAFDREIRKVNDMKSLHDIFIKNLSGHVFKGKLNKNKVLSVTESEIVLLKPDGKTKTKVSWQKFYKDYPGNFNEIINVYVYNARNTSAKIKLSPLEWTNAMLGAALTMQLVCSEVNGAVQRSEQLAKEVVKQYPTYQKMVLDVLPDMQFDGATEE